MFVYDECCGDLKEKKAGLVVCGDKVLYSEIINNKLVSDLIRITNINNSTIQRGVYAPLTTDGTLIVNGVLVSCYANISSQSIAHDSMTSLRW